MTPPPLLRSLGSIIDEGDIDLLDEAINNGADVTQQPEDSGLTPLHHAAQGECACLERLLRDPRINVDATDNDGQTPLMKAVIYGSCECVDVLLKANADATLADSSMKTVMDYAMSNGDADVLASLGADLPESPTHSSGSLPQARRFSVSSECGAAPNADDLEKIRIIPKEEAVAERIRSCVQNNILFQELDKATLDVVIAAMEEIAVKAGETLIKQGDPGDYFYIVGRGGFDCFKGGEKVYEYTDRGSFGELALMYNAPRAATVTATLDSTVYAMDRYTFRTVLLSAAMDKMSSIPGACG